MKIRFEFWLTLLMKHSCFSVPAFSQDIYVILTSLRYIHSSKIKFVKTQVNSNKNLTLDLIIAADLIPFLGLRIHKLT